MCGVCERVCVCVRVKKRVRERGRDSTNICGILFHYMCVCIY